VRSPALIGRIIDAHFPANGWSFSSNISSHLNLLMPFNYSRGDG